MYDRIVSGLHSVIGLCFHVSEFDDSVVIVVNGHLAGELVQVAPRGVHMGKRLLFFFTRVKRPPIVPDRWTVHFLSTPSVFGAPLEPE